MEENPYKAPESGRAKLASQRQLELEIGCLALAIGAAMLFPMAKAVLNWISLW